MPTALLDSFSMQLPVFIISNLFTSSLLGQYSFAFRLVNLPLTLITANLGQIFFEEFSTRYRQSVEQGRRFLFKTWRNLFFIGLVPFSILLIFGSDLFALVFGPDWEVAGRVTQTMAPLLFLMFISSPTSNAYLTLGKQKIAFIFGAALLVFRGAGLWIGYLQNNFFNSILYYTIFEAFLIVLYNILLLHFLKQK